MPEFQQEQQQHEMVLGGTQPSGADEWFCPTCGRRVIMRPAPNYERVVLVRGDEYAIHVGGKGGVRVGHLTVTPFDHAGRPGAEDRSWRQWLDDHGIEWDGPAA